MNDREDIAAHITACMRDFELLGTELALLEAGSPDPECIEITERHKGRLRKTIAEQAAAIMEFRCTTGFAVSDSANEPAPDLARHPLSAFQFPLRRDFHE
jgi:hypothetical protein